MGRRMSDLFYTGASVLSTVIDSATNTILAMLGDVVTESTDCDKADWWQHVGFASRPAKPVKGKSAAECFAVRCSDRDAVLASRDVRGQSIYGKLGDGETCIYAGGPDGKATGRVLVKADGSVTVYTQTGNTSAGNSIAFQVSPTGVSAGTPWGAMTFDSSGFQVATEGGAGIKIGNDGSVALMGTSIAINGSSVSLGANAVLPVLWGPTGVAGTASTTIKVAP